MATYKSDFLNILDQRGFIHQCSDFTGLDKKLAEGPQSAYIGFDATAPSLHVGSLVQIMMLYWFQQTGHNPITLMGGGTTKVGDPSGKDESRKLLGDDAINKNISTIKSVFGKFLDYSDIPAPKNAPAKANRNHAIFSNNADWLEKLNYIEFLRDIGVHFTINRMLTFDSVKLRLDREQPLTFLEFNYMILQGYDFVELYKRHGTILQMGGSDQWGNIINGVELGRRVLGAELFALTTPLLTTSSGAKMGKTAAGAVWLNADMLSPYDYYQYWRNAEDGDVEKFLKLFTTLPSDEIKKLSALKDAEINEAKKILAFEATKLCHGEQAAREAETTAREVFEKGGVGGDLPTIEIEKARFPVSLIDLLVETGLAFSKNEARRKIEEGAVRVNGGQKRDPNADIRLDEFGNKDYIKLSLGKKKHALIKIKP